MLAQCLATTVTGRDTTNTSWQTNADESDGMGFVPLPWDTPIDPSRLTRRGGSRTRDLLLLSRTLYQLSYQSKVYFQRASRPKAINILRKTYAKLVDSKQGGPAKVCCRPLRYLFAPVPLACRTSRATTIPRRYQQSRLCDGRRVRADGFLHVNTSAQRLGNRQPSPTPLWSWCLFDQHRCARR